MKLYLPFLSLILSSFPVDGRTPVGGGGWGGVGGGGVEQYLSAKAGVLVLQD
jgi:hypothetical protein